MGVKTKEPVQFKKVDIAEVKQKKIKANDKIVKEKP